MNAVLRTGVDLVSVSRLANLLHQGGPGFADAVWTQDEQLTSAGDPRRLAGRWGVKEAVMKMLGKGWPDVAWTEIEVVTGAGGRPSVALTGAAAAAASDAGLDAVSVSLSHEGDLAVAFAVGTGPGTGAR